MTHDQTALLKAIESGGAVGEPGPLERIDTHLSHVFLGRDRVFKLKRAVRMPFVDFLALESRHMACDAELEINRRFAPDLYLGVEPIVAGAGSGFRLGGPGEAVDWVVVMRRFPPGALFDEMAKAGTLSADLVGEAAERIARFHAEADVVPGAGRPADYLAIVDNLRRTESDGATVHGLKPGSDLIYTEVAAAIRRAAPLIEGRRAEGKVRRGHGDLHLRNICLFEGRATPFDALEFDPALATSDVLYDLAFVLMDLVHRGLKPHANLAMNRYWDTAGESEEALALLALFMALRAAVRTAVAMEAGDPAEAEAYRVLGLTLLKLHPPRLVAIGGLSGSGKSAVARLIAPELGGVCGARLLRTDVIRKASGPLAPDAYSDQARARVYDLMSARAARALAAGCSVLADATFQQAEGRAAIANSGDFRGVWLRASADVRIARVSGRNNDASDADARVAANQHEPEIEAGWTIVDAEGPLEEVAQKVRAALGMSG
jgi:aminoglycoside phosphotransferase family enzyme/predicted kinase